MSGILTENTETVQSDAVQRTVRTMAQGAIAVVLAAVIPLVINAVSGGVEAVDWAVLGYSALTAAIVALLTYVMAYVLPALNSDPVDPVVGDGEGA